VKREELVREGLRAALATRESTASAFGVPVEAIRVHHQGIVEAVVDAIMPLVEHDDGCESEFISGPNAWSPCACAARARGKR
jgi:D-aminopeptidase